MLTNGVSEVTELLADVSSRVRLLAGISAAKLQNREFLPAVLKMITENKDQDPYLRHAGAFALAEIHDFDAIQMAAKSSSPAVRMAALIAMRRNERPEIGEFVHDQDPKIVLEAARAINDVPISGAIRELASLAAEPDLSKARVELVRRVVNANFRYGTRESAQKLAAMAGNDSLPEQLRAEALDDLAEWVHPSGRDPVTGLWKPMVGARPEKDAVNALQPVIAQLIQNGPGRVRAAAARAAAGLHMSSTGRGAARLGSFRWRWISESGSIAGAGVAARSALEGCRSGRAGGFKRRASQGSVEIPI
jgi:quinoprotein glucose dehydrogenase